ncbi:MAG: hypothetical protein V7K47_02055 [Nostoc sp.]
MMTTEYQTFEVQQEMPIGDELDLQLRQLVYAAQQHPAKSAKRRKILNQLIGKIQNSGKLTRFYKYRYLLNFEDIYSEAEANTYLEICNTIEDYRPEYLVMAWVNQLFYWRFHDVKRKYRNQQSKILSLDDENGEKVDAVISRQSDNLVEIALSAELNERFSVEIILDESKVTQEFLV